MSDRCSTQVLNQNEKKKNHPVHFWADKSTQKQMYSLQKKMNMNNVLEQKLYCSLDPTSQKLQLTSLANSCRVFRLRFPPRPLRRPTTNWPRSLTALRCDRPLKTVPTRLVSTTKSFCRNGKQVWRERTTVVLWGFAVLSMNLLTSKIKSCAY